MRALCLRLLSIHSAIVNVGKLAYPWYPSVIFRSFRGVVIAGPHPVFRHLTAVDGEVFREMDATGRKLPALVGGGGRVHAAYRVIDFRFGEHGFDGYRLAVLAIPQDSLRLESAAHVPYVHQQPQVLTGHSESEQPAPCPHVLNAAHEISSSRISILHVSQKTK